MLLGASQRETAIANHAVTEASERETAARDAFRDAQEQGFPKGT